MIHKRNLYNVSQCVFLLTTHSLYKRIFSDTCKISFALFSSCNYFIIMREENHRGGEKKKIRVSQTLLYAFRRTETSFRFWDLRHDEESHARDLPDILVE